METKLKSMFVAALTLAASTQKVRYQSYPCGNSYYFRLDRRVEVLEL